MQRAGEKVMAEERVCKGGWLARIASYSIVRYCVFKDE